MTSRVERLAGEITMSVNQAIDDGLSHVEVLGVLTTAILHLAPNAPDGGDNWQEKLPL